MVDTVDWAADGSLDGTGTGTLANGAITVTYTTEVGVGNAGVTLAEDWDVSLATNGAVGSGVTHKTGGVFGTTAAMSPQTIMFSSPVKDPVLFANFSDDGTSMDFGALSLTFLDSNNAQLVGSMVTFTGSTNSFHDGFAARIAGTFGPGTPITFTYTPVTQGVFQSVAFTVAAVPEPSTILLLGIGLAGLTAACWRKRKS
jgi:hypothetical protein